jgi:hypothetical protein
MRTRHAVVGKLTAAGLVFGNDRILSDALSRNDLGIDGERLQKEKSDGLQKAQSGRMHCSETVTRNLVLKLRANGMQLLLHRCNLWFSVRVGRLLDVVSLLTCPRD